MRHGAAGPALQGTAHVVVTSRHGLVVNRTERSRGLVESPRRGSRPYRGAMPAGFLGELDRFLRASLFTPVPRDHAESDMAIRRRRIVCALALAAGAVLLGLSLSLPPGDDRFYLYMALVAAIWTVGSFASGKIYMGQAHTRRGDRYAVPVVQSLALATLLLAVFLIGAVLVARVPVLRGHVNAVLDYARFGSLPIVAVLTLINGLAEELFFRGAVFSAVPAHHQISISTLLYMLVTLATGNVMLVFAAAVLGTVVALQRRVTGGVVAPMITHVVWSCGMLFLLPTLLDWLS
jgi:membrane protease YdiL (CAAX protease family)